MRGSGRECPGRPSALLKKEFKSPRLCFSKSLDFENDAVRRAFFQANQAARQVALFGPQMNQRIFRFEMYFAMQPSQLGQPLAVFADFDGP